MSYTPTALTSPIEYQRNHVGGGGPSGPTSSSSGSTGGHPGGNSPNSMSNIGGGGGGGSGVSGGNSLCGPRSRPSRIPQPSSRLPQPVHHHHHPGPEGPDRSTGMWSNCQTPCSNPFPETNGELSGAEGQKLKMLDGPCGANSNNSNRMSGSTEAGFRQAGCEDTPKPAAKPQRAIAPLNLSLKSPRIGTVAPMMSQSIGGQDTPASPAHKGNPFWAVVPPVVSSSPASRPASFSFPGEGERGSLGTPSYHRLSAHSKDIDRMSTCSSTSEQSIQSTQSNGVRCPAMSGDKSYSLETNSTFTDRLLVRQ